MKIVTIIGARPQFIKAATVSRVLEIEGITEVLVHTGQHYDVNMSSVFFDEMGIPEPRYNLGIGGGSHGAMTGQQLEQIEKVLLEETPQIVLVYGDTNSTLAGALAATKLHIPVAHVEAGLRSYNRRMPEEVNRVLTDHVADILFAPTETSRKNLLNEGVSGSRINVVGDVMFDAAMYYRDRGRQPPWFDSMGLGNSRFVLCTVHRAENTDDPERLVGILQGLADSGLPVILPMHPRTRAKISKYKLGIGENVHVLDPVGYLEMVWLETNCSIVATDSGGVQKEAFFHAKPCVTLRDETEWIELVAMGANVLVGTDRQRISQALGDGLGRTVSHEHVYGDGHAAERVVESILKWEP